MRCLRVDHRRILHRAYPGFSNGTRAAQIDNNDCNLKRNGDTAYFVALSHTNCKCVPMPGQVPGEANTYYQLSLNQNDVHGASALDPADRPEASVAGSRASRGLALATG